MSGTEKTFHMTEADVAKAQSQASKAHGGDVPAGSEAAMMQSIMDKEGKDKATIIAERQANLPLPDDPPGKSDFSSADARTVNIGSGEQPTGNFSSGDDALRGPATGESIARADPAVTRGNVQGGGVGREGADGLPNDAVAQGSKNKQTLSDTTNENQAANKAAGA